MASKIRTGDVFELATPCGYAYLQYSHEHPEYSSLIRVLDGLHPKRPDDLAEFVAAPERFVVFFHIKSALSDGFVERIGQYPLPQAARDFPQMRMSLFGTGWLILANAVDEVARVRDLNPEQRLTPTVEIWPQPILRSRVASTWSWADDADDRQVTEPATPCHDIGVPWPVLDDVQPDAADEVDHYAYFPTREAANEAKRRVAPLAARVVTEPSADGSGQWLAKATVRVEQSDDLEDALVRAAAELGGEYDGSEQRLG